MFTVEVTVSLQSQRNSTRILVYNGACYRDYLNGSIIDPLNTTLSNTCCADTFTLGTSGHMEQLIAILHDYGVSNVSPKNLVIGL